MREEMRKSHAFEAIFLLTIDSIRLKTPNKLGIFPEPRPHVMNTVHGGNIQIRATDTGQVTLDYKPQLANALPPKIFGSTVFCAEEQPTHFPPTIDPHFMVDQWACDALFAMYAALVCLCTDLPDSSTHPGVVLFPPRVVETRVRTVDTIRAVIRQLNERARTIAKTCIMHAKNEQSRQDAEAPDLPLVNQYVPMETDEHDKKGTKFVFHPLRKCGETAACRQSAQFAATAASLTFGTPCLFSRGTAIISGVKSPEELTHVHIEQTRIINRIRDPRGRRAFVCTRFKACTYNLVQSGHFGFAVNLNALRQRFTYNPGKHPSATSAHMHDQATITVFTGGAYNVCGKVKNSEAAEIVRKTKEYFKEVNAIIKAKTAPSHRARIQEFNVQNMSTAARPPAARR